MPGRPKVPGERPWGNIHSPMHVHDRTVRGIVKSVNTKDGFITWGFDGLPASGRHASIPWLWASFPDSGRAAWGRYIPFDTDGIKISFDIDDRPHVVGYDTLAGSVGSADGRAGYSAISRAYEDNAVINFQELNSGEFDFMSVGGSYIYGSDTGELLLSTDIVSLELVGADNSIYSHAGLYNLTSSSSSIHFGEVRRSGINPGVETRVGPWNPSTTGREFTVSLNNEISTLPIAYLGIGNLATDTIVRMMKGIPQIVALDVYDMAGVSVVSNLGMDAIGNIELNGLHTTIGGYISLGSGHAIEPVVLGFSLNNWLNALIDALSGVIGTDLFGLPVTANPALITILKALSMDLPAHLSTKVLSE